MIRSVFKMTWRTVRTFIGRYIAIFLIVMLSVGFFSGLRITKDAMAQTCEDFFAEHDFYDFRLLTTLGFEKDDVDEINELSFIRDAEGSFGIDALLEDEDGESMPYKLISLPERLNTPSVISGRLPDKSGECLVDSRVFGEDDIGKVLLVSGENGEDTTKNIKEERFEIVGIADSPMYLGIGRGSTNIGSGSIRGFVYVPEEAFDADIYTEIFAVLNESAEIYSDEYDDLIEKYMDDLTDECEKIGDDRFEAVLEEYGVTAEMAEMMGISKPDVYVLTRDENTGYVSFENDTSIVSGIANIFPIFFILIAVLVCITTMTRMVDEERTQLGVLKALGYGGAAITGKYLLYAGSATVFGWAVGFFLGIWGLPKVFWLAYNALYDFAPLSYVFSPSLAIITLAVALAGILGSTYISCKGELTAQPAALIRPRAAKKGRRILLERFTALWHRLTFLQKITLRNMFRYKKRMIMMLIGIGCCAGLLVAAFGVRDSMINIGELQYEGVQKYQLEVSFTPEEKDAFVSSLKGTDGVADYFLCARGRVDISSDESDTGMDSVNFISAKLTREIRSFWTFKDGEDVLYFPKDGEALVNKKIAETLGIEEGDVITVEDSDMNSAELRVSGIFDNYIDNYIIIPSETYEEKFGEWSENTALISVEGDPEEVGKRLTECDGITGVSHLKDTEQRVTEALSCLDYIICMVVLFSGALEFIVIFNLTNINLAERSREVATVEVLGFYPKETESYILRENVILSLLASVIGLPIGVGFHIAVMSMIKINSITFDNIIKPESYVIAFICTVLFALAVNVIMRRQIGKIKMAESLKAIE